MPGPVLSTLPPDLVAFIQVTCLLSADDTRHAAGTGCSLSRTDAPWFWSSSRPVG